MDLIEISNGAQVEELLQPSVCRDADDAVHEVCYNPDKRQQRIEERKIKIGGNF